MIEARKNILFQKIFAVYTKRLLRKTFNGIYIKGDENFFGRDKNLPTVIYLNHSNWWDAIIPFYLSYSVWNADGYAFMDIEQLQKYRFFRRIGVFSVDRKSASEGMKSLNYGLELLKKPETLLWIFPQGELLHNGIRPLIFQNGLAYLLDKAVKVNAIPMAVNYEFMMEQRPEIYISVSKPVDLNVKMNRNEMTVHLNKVLTELLDDQKKMIVNYRTDGYKTLMTGRKSKNKIIDRMQNAGA